MLRIALRLAQLGGFVVFPLALLTSPAGQKPKVGFDAVQMTLKASCASCHSGQGAIGGFDVDSPESILKRVVPGDAGKSDLVKRLRGLGVTQMPKGFAPLPEGKIKEIETWISEGADIKARSALHWSLRPIEMPVAPASGSPWVKNPIDSFVLARLEKEGLKPSPEAPKETLVRRLYLDLIGLPPSPTQVDEFLADTRPNAYEILVDKLLASPHYGEKQARPWLDLARYADTNGYEKDGIRTAYLYRDWVISAFNENMPYDRFSIQQLAGDLLPGATSSQRVATGFNRNTMWNLEGGVDPEESRYEALNDRTAATGTVWLGLTVGCARCHDHKYDPISQKDYFQLYAYFANGDFTASGDPKVTTQVYTEPSISLPSPEQRAQMRQLESQIAALNGKLSADDPALARDRAEFVRALRTGFAWSQTTTSVTTAGASVTKDTDGVILASGKNPEQARYRLRVKIPAGGIRAVRVEVLPDGSLAQMGPGRASSGNFILSKVWVEQGSDRIVPVAAAASFTQNGYSAEGVLDDNPESGWAIGPRYGQAHQLIAAFAKPITGEYADVILDCASKTWINHNLGKFRVTVCESGQALADLASEAVRKKAQEPGAENDPTVIEAHRGTTPLLGEARVQLQSAQLALDKVRGEVPSAMVMADKAGVPAKTHIHVRGEFANLGEEVSCGTPSALPAAPAGLPANRLGLARWLFEPENPLTARVQVNRMWEAIFGRGIVETSENFGTQGSAPTHPELLDCLAATLRDSGWNLKKLNRMIVTSATYRQSSAVTPALLEKDPNNLLLARGPRFRLDAEGIRDVTLSSAGMLNPKVGGPSVFPLQPEGVWDSPYSGERWMTSEGGDRYRRGLYTFWKRTSTYPSFVALDATSRETCTVRRTRTNTPLQSLALLNDLAAMDAARGLAARVKAEGGATDSERIAYAFRLCTSRKPTTAEATRLGALLLQMKTHFMGDPAAAKKVAQDSESAAWTMVANVLLNLDETITKE